MKKILSVIFVLVMWFATNITVFASDIPNHTENFYVNDFADIFTDSQESDMMLKSLELAENYDGVQVVVTTIKTTNGTNIDSYATKMYNNYKIGNDSKGVLILIATEDRNVVLRTGDNFSNVISDSKAKNIIDSYGIPKLKNNDFAGGIIAMFNATYDNIVEYYAEQNKEINSNINGGVVVKEDNDKFSNMGYIIGLVLVACGWIINVIFVSYSGKLRLKDKEKEMENAINNEKINYERANEKIVSLRNQLNYKEKEIEDKDKIIQDYRKKLDIACELHKGLIGEIKEREEYKKVIKQKSELLDIYGRLKEVNSSSINSFNEEECKRYLNLKRSFDDKFRDFKNIRVWKDGETTREINEALTLIIVDENMTSVFEENCKIVKDRLIEIEKENNERAARELEKILDNAKRRKSKYACKDAIREYERTSRDITCLLAPMYIAMYHSMKDAVKHPTYSNDFFPADYDYSSSSSDNNGYSSSFSPSSFGGFGGGSSGGGASSSF